MGNNIINNNTLIDNRPNTISLYHQVTNNTIINNVFRSSDIVKRSGISLYFFGNEDIEDWISHNIENNFINDKPIRFYKNNENVIVPYDTAQVILANCTNCTIQNLHLSNVNIGIQIGYSSYNIISNNTIKDGLIGIDLFYSSYNVITRNSIINRITKVSIANCGIQKHFSNNNKINSNNIIDNHYGIHSLFSSNNSIIGNNINNNTVGIYIDIGSNHSIVKENNFIRNLIHATFRMAFFINWSNNYWGYRSGIILKPIIGVIKDIRLKKPYTIRINLIFRHFSREILYIEIYWVNFDWHPAREPYDIPI
jgi:parallel beta-helix repeat protein